jgi:4-alpha-glucanotransferase
MDSADVWVHPDLFELDEDLKPIRIAGVPPDYFSPTGQRWGNPLYRWDLLAAHGFDWWIERIRRACELYDIVRLDHFRGFEAYWAIPADEETAVNGEWIKAPGLALFQALEAALGHLPLVAEDLGMITPEVEVLRLALDLPGMKVIQFGFSNKGAHIHLPHRFNPANVAYTGTHDNNTTQGWWETIESVERTAVETYVGAVPTENGVARPVWPLIRATEASVAQISVVPAQDLLELGAEARMNTPSVAAGNWSWRAPESCWTPELTARLAALVEITDRNNDPLAKTGEEDEV